MAIIPQFFMEATVALGVPANPEPLWCASGFIVGRFEGTNSSGEDEFSTYLITNKHVVKDLSAMVVQVNRIADVKAYNLILMQDGIAQYSSHPSSDVIACHININPAVAEGAQIPFFDFRQHSLTLQEMKQTGVSEGCLVYTLGFPVSITNDFVNHSVKTPVCRMGCISRIENVYHDASACSFLVDAVAFPGNSGGPVISRPEHISITDTPHNTSANLIGIVSQYLPYQEILCSTQTGRNRMISEENSGLTVVVPVDCIREVVEAERTRVYGIASSDKLAQFQEFAPPSEPALV